MVIKMKILVISSANMDFVMNMHAVPAAGQTVIDNGTYRYVPGGKGANSAMAFRRLGADRIWGCAKVPDYYSQYGWIRINKSLAPDISDCQTCRQFHKTCFPCIIMKEL